MNISKIFRPRLSSAIKQKLKAIRRKSLKAFTLIELLVVIAIIGILSALIFVSMNGAQASARDGRRQSELSQTKKALQAYYLQNGRYPTTSVDGISLESDSDTNGTFSQTMKAGGYMSIIPRDPKYAASAGDYAYKYIATSTNAFILCAKTEVSVGYACIDQTSGGGIAFSPEPPVDFGGWGGGGGGFTCGVSTVTFTYNGSSVTYGTVTSANDECWMDRNLGAAQVATTSTDSTAYGDLFQWGRSDDGHQIRSPSPGTIEGDMTLTSQPGHTNFIKEQSEPGDWALNSWTTRWLDGGGAKTSADPCPAGWRVPNYAEWQTEITSWSQQDYQGSFASPLKLTVGGFRIRDDASINFVDSGGYYCTSAASGSYSFTARFSLASAVIYSSRRADAFSVRCIKD